MNAKQRILPNLRYTISFIVLFLFFVAASATDANNALVSRIDIQSITGSDAIEIMGREYATVAGDVVGNTTYSDSEISGINFDVGSGSLSLSSSDRFRFEDGGVEVDRGLGMLKYSDKNSFLVTLNGIDQTETAHFYLMAGTWSQDVGRFQVTGNGMSQTVTLPSSYAWHRFKVSVAYQGAVEIEIRPMGEHQSYSSLGLAGVILDKQVACDLSGCDDGSTDPGNDTDVEAPTSPQNLSASAVTNTGLTLSWEPSSDNVEVLGYFVYRNGQQIAETTGNSYVDTGLQPDSGYSYEVQAFDAQQNLSAKSDVLFVTTASDQADLTMPTGIPMPSFGLLETAPARPVDWTEEFPGFYYINPSHPDARDSVTYGSESQPRLSIPDNIPPGSVVELHGVFTNAVRLQGIVGTQEEPIYLRGLEEVNPPIFHKKITVIDSAYVILENVKTAPESADTGNSVVGISIREGSHHIAIRDSELSGAENGLGPNKENLNRVGSLSIGSWGYDGVESAHHIVIANNHIHDMGNLNDTGDQDAHCMNVNGTVTQLWILNNELRRCSGDGVQIEAQASRGVDKIQYVYAGGNQVSHNKQTGLWIKHAKHVIFSENHVSHHAPSSSGGGVCIGYQYAGDHVWIINNTVHDCPIGIGAMSGSSGLGTQVFYIGNVIYNIASETPENPHRAGGIVLRMNAVVHNVVNNTIYNADRAIGAPIQSSASLNIFNNVFSKTFAGSQNTIYLESVTQNVQMDNNIISAEDGFDINWSGSHYLSLAEFTQARSQCVECVDSHVEFVNADAANPDFHLSSGFDHGVTGDVNDVYAYFESLYGLSILKDLTGVERPSDNSIEIGALE